MSLIAALCPAGFTSPNGLAPCDQCPLNSYQPKPGQRACLKCPVGKTTLSKGASRVSQCFGIYLLYFLVFKLEQVHLAISSFNRNFLIFFISSANDVLVLLPKGKFMLKVHPK